MNKSQGSTPKAKAKVTPIKPAPAPSGSTSSTTCPYCQRNFTRISVLNVHIEMVHAEEEAAKLQQQLAEDDYEDVDEVLDDDDEGAGVVGNFDPCEITVEPVFYDESSEEDSAGPNRPDPPLGSLQRLAQEKLEKKQNPGTGSKHPSFAQLRQGLGSGSKVHQPKPGIVERTLPPSLTVTMTKNASHISPNKQPRQIRPAGKVPIPAKPALDNSSASEEEDDNPNRKVNLVM